MEPVQALKTECFSMNTKESPFGRVDFTADKRNAVRLRLLRYRPIAVANYAFMVYALNLLQNLLVRKAG